MEKFTTVELEMMLNALMEVSYVRGPADYNYIERVVVKRKLRREIDERKHSKVGVHLD
jgi:hypothetical protein